MCNTFNTPKGGETIVVKVKVKKVEKVLATGFTWG
jgi:hypothetical protein